MVSPPSWQEALRLFLEWARENHVGPLQTFILAISVVGLFFFARFVRSAKNVVNDVHHVYEKALEDQKKAADSLRSEVSALRRQRRVLLEELEDERKVKEDLLRTLARYRAEKAAAPPAQE